jgi:hypothetical protein
MITLMPEPFVQIDKKTIQRGKADVGKGKNEF